MEIGQTDTGLCQLVDVGRQRSRIWVVISEDAMADVVWHDDDHIRSVLAENGACEQ